MAALAELVVALVGDTGDFEQKMSGAGASLQSLGSQMTSVGTSLTAGVSLPLLGVGTAAVAMAVDFNAGMANIASLSSEAQARVGEWGPAVQEMAVQVGQSTGSLEEGLYQVVSAFGATDESLGILEINAVAAAAGLATTAEAIGLTSAVTKAYGDTSAGAVQQVADLAQMTVSMGQTTFPELAGSIGAVAPLASNLGVDMETLFAVMATGAGVTGSTGEVATQLRGILQSLMAPTESMGELFSQLGWESGQAMVETVGLRGTIMAVVQAAQQSGTPLQSYIGSIEGQTLAMALAGPQAATLANNLDAMAGAAGASQSAFATQTQGVNAVGFSMQQAAVQVQVWGQQLGNALLPVLGQVMGALQPVVDWVSQLIGRFTEASPATQMVVIGIGALAAAAGPVLMVLGSLVSAIGALLPVVGGIAAAFTAAGGAAGILGGVFAFLTGPIGLIIAAVVGLGVAWSQNWGGIQEKTQAVIAWLQGVVVGVVQAIIAWWNAAWPSIQATIQAVWAGVQTVIQTVVAWLQANIMAAVGAVIAWWNTAWPSIQATLQAVWAGIQSTIQTVIGIIGPTVQGLIETIRGAFSNVGPIIEQFKGLWQSLGPLFQSLMPVVQFVGQVIMGILGALGAAFMAVVGVVVGVVNGIIGALGPLVSGVMGAIDNVIGIFTGLITFVTGFWNAIVGLFTGNSQLVQQGLQQMGDGIIQIWTNLVNGVISLAEGLVGAVIGFVTGLVDGVITFFTNLYQTLVGGSIVPDMVNAIIQWFNTLLATGTAIMQAIQAAIEAIWNAISAFLTATWQTIVATVTAALASWQAINDAVMNAISAFIQSIWNAIFGFLSGIWSAIISLVTSSMAAVQSIIVAVWTAVQAFWQSIWTAIQGFTQAVWAAITSLIQAALSAIQAAAVAFMNLIQGAWSAFLNVIEGLWQAAWSSIAGILQSALGTLTSIANAIVSAIFGAFNQDWGSIGRNIVDSIGNALRAGLQWVADQARRIAEAALQAAMDALGIGSPSKEFMYLGDMSVAGFAGAFDDVRPVERAVVRAIDGALGAGSRAAGSGGGSVDRSVRIGQVMIPGSSGMSVLEQMRAYGR
jgi:TP901 family phage tail tape measure protein